MIRFFYTLACIFAALTWYVPASAQPLPPDGEWLDIPGTSLAPALPTTAELGSTWCREVNCPGAPVGGWTGFQFDPNAGIMSSIRNGGHTHEGGGADSYDVPLESALLGLPSGTTWWTRVEPVQHLTGQLDNNGRCPFPAWGPPSQHSYDGSLLIDATHGFVSGYPGFCDNYTMTPGRWFYSYDRSTTPWTWTHQPQLDTYGGAVATALDGQNIVLDTYEGKYALIDKDTFAIIKSGSVRGVIVNGVQQPYSSGYTAAAMGAGDVNANHLFCLQGFNGTGGYINCSQVDGTRDPSCNGAGTNPTCQDNSFGRVKRYPIGTNAVPGSPEAEIMSGKMAVTALPDNRFAIWGGQKQIWFFDPATGTFTTIRPTTGPSGTTNVYGKLFYWPAHCVLVGYSNPDQNVWMFKVPGIDCAPPPQPQQQSDFERRSTAPGVVFAQDFSDPATVPNGNKGVQGVFCNQGVLSSPTGVRPVVANGMLWFTILNHSGAADACQYVVHFPPIGPGGKLYVAWDQFIPRALLYQRFLATDGGSTSFKLSILDEPGNASCTGLFHIVVNKSPWREFSPVPDTGDALGGLQAVVGCPNSSPIQTAGPKQSSRPWDSQPIGQDALAVDANGKLISHQCWEGHRDNCVQMVPSIWATYQESVECPIDSYPQGDKIFWDCRFTLSQKVRGQPKQLVIDTVTQIRRVNETLGSLYLLPYMTHKSREQTHPDFQTMVDNVIISTHPIPDPVE